MALPVVVVDMLTLWVTGCISRLCFFKCYQRRLEQDPALYRWSLDMGIVTKNSPLYKSGFLSQHVWVPIEYISVIRKISKAKIFALCSHQLHPMVITEKKLSSRQP